MAPKNTTAPTTAQEKALEHPQHHAGDPVNQRVSRVEILREQGARDSDSMDSGINVEESDSSEADPDSDEDMKSFEMVPKTESRGQVVPNNEGYDTFEDTDDFTIVNRCSPGLSNSFSEMKTCDDRAIIGSPKQRSANRKKPYDYVKEEVNETSSTAIRVLVDQSRPVTVISQHGAASSQSLAGTVSSMNYLVKTSPNILHEAVTAPIVKQEESKPSAPVDFHDVHKKLCDFVLSVLSVSQLVETFQCCEDAIKLRKVAMIMTESHQLHKFLMVFSHSVSCANDSCTNTCRMFRRTRGHVGSASHPCALMHVYSQLLRMHIDTCVDDKCGLVTCKSMLAMRQVDDLSVLPRHFKLLEQLIAQKTGKIVIKPSPALNKVDASENKENILNSCTPQQTTPETECVGVLNLTKKAEIPSEADGDKALDLSKTSDSTFDVQKATVSARG